MITSTLEITDTLESLDFNPECDGHDNEEAVCVAHAEKDCGCNSTVLNCARHRAETEGFYLLGTVIRSAQCGHLCVVVGLRIEPLL